MEMSCLSYRRFLLSDHPSKLEVELYEAILMEEVEIQSWYAITHVGLIGEVFLCKQ